MALRRSTAGHQDDHGVLHRDLKCQNVFVDARDVVKIGDFGISKILTSRSGFCSTVVGTPYYLSPEMCTGERYDEKSDVWALGCILYELCHAGARAFEGRSLPALVMNILRGAYAPPSPRRLSPELRDLQARMLRRDPRRRPTAREILASPAVRPHAEGMEGADPAFFRDDPPRAPARTKARNTNDAPGRPRDPSSRPKPRPNPRPNPDVRAVVAGRARSLGSAGAASELWSAGAPQAEGAKRRRRSPAEARARRCRGRRRRPKRAPPRIKNAGSGAGSRIDRRAMNPAFREPRARGEPGRRSVRPPPCGRSRNQNRNRTPPVWRPYANFLRVLRRTEAPPDGDEGVSTRSLTRIRRGASSSTTFLPDASRDARARRATGPSRRRRAP